MQGGVGSLPAAVAACLRDLSSRASSGEQAAPQSCANAEPRWFSALPPMPRLVEAIERLGASVCYSGLKRIDRKMRRATAQSSIELQAANTERWILGLTSRKAICVE